VRGALYLAARYLGAHPLKTTLLVVSITLILSIPACLRVLVGQGERELRSRAVATPIVLGAKGSPVELVLNSLYFGGDVPETIHARETDRVRATGFALAIPMYVRYHAQDAPIVGTTLDYLDFRGLRVVRGHPMGRLGDCMLGARVARERGLGPGDHVISSPESVFDLAGVYPLRMRVAGVLAPTGTPDDEAVFVDLKTAWVIEGLGHGHEDLSRPEAQAGVLKREGETIVANASVRQYNEITDENIASFHFHGDPGDFPITAVIAVPKDAKSQALLLGRYRTREGALQMLRPSRVMDDLLGTILTVQGFVVAALVLVGITTLATAALVFALSVQLRRREIATMVKIGGSRACITTVLASEILGVVLAGVALAALLTWITSLVGADALRSFLT